MSRIALVAGATGLVGGKLLRQLLARDEYSEVRVLGRRPPPLDAGKLRFIASDFTRLEDLDVELKVDDVFCCLGTTIKQAGSQAAFERVDYHMVVDLARAAQKSGARRFLVVSAAGASAHSPVFYSRVKARMEEAVAALPFEAVHIVRPSLLLGERKDVRAGEWLGQLVAPLLTPLMVGPLRKYQPIQADAVAASLVRLALKGEAGAHVHALPLR
jgi:uncharacterized protein YbjT (DUF2867 family)